MSSALIGILAGFAVAVVLFGGIFLATVLHGRKDAKKAEPAKSPDPEDMKPADVEEEEDEKEAEELDEKLEKEIAEELEEEKAEEKAEEPVEEPVEEEPVVVAEEVAEEEVIADAAEEDEEEEEEPEEDEEDEAPEDEGMPSDETVAVLAAEKADETVRLDKSFQARIIQADDASKEAYAEVKAAAMAYTGARCYTAWKQERVKVGRKVIAKFVMRGKTLCLFLPLDPKQFENTTLKVEDVSDKSVNAETPTMLRLKNARRTKQAKQLIAQVAKEDGIGLSGKKVADYHKGLAYRTDAYLMEKGLIKVVHKTAYPAKK